MLKAESDLDLTVDGPHRAAQAIRTGRRLPCRAGLVKDGT